VAGCRIGSQQGLPLTTGREFYDGFYDDVSSVGGVQRPIIKSSRLRVAGCRIGSQQAIPLTTGREFYDGFYDVVSSVGGGQGNIIKLKEMAHRGLHHKFQKKPSPQAAWFYDGICDAASSVGGGLRWLTALRGCNVIKPIIKLNGLVAHS
jgi:hypothetical protein